MRQSKKQKAIAAIEKQGVLLVFPIRNAREPQSLWFELFPKKEMIWEWSDEASDEVPFLWSLMKELSAEGEVIYSKWYQDRATFFSRDCFAAMLTLQIQDNHKSLKRSEEKILGELLNNSPLSTKELKELAGLQGRFFASEYNRSLRTLFRRLLIVGFGEKADGAFPSASIGATELIFEDLWNRAKNNSLEDAQSIIDLMLPVKSHFRNFFDKTFF